MLRKVILTAGHILLYPFVAWTLGHSWYQLLLGHSGNELFAQLMTFCMGIILIAIFILIMVRIWIKEIRTLSED
jgi:hypothetical protein